MQLEFVSILGYVLAIAMGAFAYTAWRRSQGLHDLLVEAANRFEMSRRHVHQLESDAQKVNEKLALARDSAHKNGQALEEQRTRHLDMIRQLEAKLEDATDSTRKKESKLDHYHQQVDALTQQLAEAHREIKALKSAPPPAPVVPEADPKELADLKRRLEHAEHLYVSMKGRREMADERNQNWEKALRLLAGSILKEGGDPRTLQQKNVGQIVGAALEKIGARLIEDDEQDSGIPDDNMERTASATDRSSSTTT